MTVTSSPSDTGVTPAALTPAAQATRAAIMDTAEQLFRSIGYHKTTVADIARDLRMSPANVYRFFPSKAAINEAIAARILAGYEAAIWEVARGPGSPPDRVRGLFALLHERTMTLFFHERRMHDMVAAAIEEHWSVVEGFLHTIDAAFTHVVRDGLEAGVFGGVDAEAAGKLMHCTCPTFAHPTLVQQCLQTENLAAVAAAMAEFCLRALRPDPAG